MKVKVTGECYRVGDIDYDELNAAIKAAYTELIRGNYQSLKIQRITKHEPIPRKNNEIMDELWGPRVETITGEYDLAGPALLRMTPELSRYHPVNGWVIPDEIEVENEG